ncbi:rhodanese-like domain-containing protein [Arthrobacter sp. H5]|uniref:rhodanese-like domain-containing protein n=1 Tax=Arthrobacter sp. H5 TaxID=1267973 RepID=UPI0004801944|nr:rhodanese-like domain-containing protein [Arthrobacter sp. H5]
MSEFENVLVDAVSTETTVLDVREDYEWQAGHIDGALHIPVEQIPARLEELDPDEDVQVICRTGGRSFRVAQWLVANGYSAVNVAGGMDAWVEASKPIVSESGKEPRVL